MDEKFNMFMETVDESFRSFVNQINGYLTENGCKCDIKLQKCGYVVSYVLNSNKRTLATFVSRKTGMKLRIYPDDCNPKCIMGYTFALDGEQYQKCRYMAFQPTLSEENNPYIEQFLEKELQATLF